MTKIVYNACYGGFGLSEAAMRLYAQKKGLPLFVFNPYGIDSDLGKQYFTADPSEYISDEKGYPAVDHDFYSKYSLYDRDFDRTDPVLVEVVEELGEKANDTFSELRVRELEPGTMYRIEEYDGYETIETRESIDWKEA